MDKQIVHERAKFAWASYLSALPSYIISATFAIATFSQEGDTTRHEKALRDTR
jgi:hypothetical protein